MRPGHDRRSARPRRATSSRPTWASTTRRCSLSTTVNNKLKIVGADGATVSKNGKTGTGPSVTLAGAQPGIPTVEIVRAQPAGLPPAGCLRDRSPIVIGDEEILNFNVPAYQFNGG